MMYPIFIVIVILTFLWIRRPIRPPKYPPGPPMFPLLGNAREMWMLLQNKSRELFTTLRTDYGDISGVILPGGMKIVHLFKFDDIRDASFSSDFAGRLQSFGALSRTFGRPLGLANSEGTIWMEHRRFALRNLRDMGFGKHTMESIVIEEFEELATEMMEAIGKPMKVNMRFNITVLNIIWRLVAGERLVNSDPMTQKLIDSVNEMFHLLGKSPMNFAPKLRFIAPEWSGYAGMVRHREFTSSMFKRLVEEHRETFDPDNPRDFIDMFLIEMQKEDAQGRYYTEENLTIIGMDFFAAGMETTSTSLTWALLFIVMHPDVQTKVQQEIDQVLGGQTPSYTDRTRMPYTEATLMEVTRRATVFPQGVPHRTTVQTKLGDYIIPSNVMIMMHLESVHMDASHWGDPEAFRPERFLDADGTVRKDDHLIPFGVGKRFCLGETLARMEMFVLFVCLLQRFRFSAAPGQKLTLEHPYAVVSQPQDFYVTYELRA